MLVERRKSDNVKAYKLSDGSWAVTYVVDSIVSTTGPILLLNDEDFKSFMRKETRPMFVIGKTSDSCIFMKNVILSVTLDSELTKMYHNAVEKV